MTGGGGAGRRLSALDGSFLRLESPRAHMHVGWTGVFAAPVDRDRPTLAALRERMAARLNEVPWCRWRLESGLLSLSEPSWVQDREFDLAAQVQALSDPAQPVSYARFATMRDELVSAPLDRSRPLWQIYLIPRLEDGRVGMIGKIHHALVDGVAALQIVGLVVDAPPDAVTNRRLGSPSPGPGSAVGRAFDRAARTIHRVSQPAVDGLGVLKATAAGAARPHATARAAVRDAKRVLHAARDDLLPRASQSSALNVAIGTRRTLVGYHAPGTGLRAARAGGGTLNDVGLTMVSGALRALALRRGDTPLASLKAMVPVSTRRAGQTGPGNQISMVYVQLPVDLASPQQRLESVCAQTQQLKHDDRAENMRTLYAAGGLLPAQLRSPATKAMSSAWMFNLTVSQSPGPRGIVHLFGGELQEVYSVVPIADQHALAIGMVRYNRELFIGCYADPDALPDVRQLPALLDAEMRALGRATPSPRTPGAAHSSGRSPAALQT